MVRVLVALWLMWSASAAGFKIGTALTPACHERITLKAIDALTLSAGELHSGRLLEDWNRPESEAELRLSRYFLAIAQRPEEEPSDLKFGRPLNSFLVGVRFPDIEGLEFIELGDLREVHLSTIDQESHFLRARSDDDELGNSLALSAGRTTVLRLIDESKRLYDASPTTREVETWVDGYGRIRVPVIPAAFTLGRAFHALQDSFTHTYRTDDLRRVLVVQTYSDAFRADYDEARDGPKHSDFLDDCSQSAVSMVERAATEASSQLAKATQRYWRTGDRGDVEAVLDRWLEERRGCLVETQYCGSPWVPLGRLKETSSLCSAATASGAWWPLAFVVGMLARRRRGTVARRGRKGGHEGGPCAKANRPVGIHLRGPKV
jgi:hypothetical protein